MPPSPVHSRGRPRRVLVAMSGGVDSAVAAYLLHRAGHEVVGATMRLYCYEREEGPARPCCDLEAVREARRSADAIGIPHTTIDMEAIFRREVVANFIDEYASARTPNPCVRCNTYVKFGPLIEKAERMGFDAIATGHYARCLPLDPSEEGFGLFRGRDAEKDQSYVLWGLDRSRLHCCLFPLGGARKSAVRRLARRAGLAAGDRPDSQDLCFVPAGEHGRFLAERLPADHTMRRPGLIRRIDGAVVGRHDGLLGATIGQRRGVSPGGAERLYVVRLEPETATLWVGTQTDARADRLVASGVNLLAPLELLTGPGVTARVRYRHPPVACRVRPLPADRCEVWLAAADQAIAPGQSVVFYAGDRVLGGGWIEMAGKEGVPPLAQVDRSISTDQ